MPKSWSVARRQGRKCERSILETHEAVSRHHAFLYPLKLTFNLMAFTFQSRATELTPQQQVMQIASAQSVHSAFQWFRLHENKLRELQMEFAAIPAPPFREQARAKWLCGRFAELELQDIEIDEIDNVIAFHKCGTTSLDDDNSRRKAVAVTAHLD